MRTLAFFNNKGGVGKTTLSCNFASFVAKELRQRVLVLDLDPQCNSTQLLLDEDVWDAIYADPHESLQRTVMAPLRPIREGDSSVDASSLPAVTSSRFGVDVLPGHPGLSTIEDILGGSWADFRGGTLGAARRSCWLRFFLAGVIPSYDLVVCDVGPSLGSVNRSCLIGSDYFVTPMAADLFSLYALDNISGWFDKWLKDYELGYSQVAPLFEGATQEQAIPNILPIRSGFLGYTVQQYVTKTKGGGERRHIAAYDRHRQEIPARAEGLASLATLPIDDLDLGTVPNMFSMIPLAQSLHAPIADLSKQDGLLGAQISQQARYKEQLDQLFRTIYQRLTEGAGEPTRA